MMNIATQNMGTEVLPVYQVEQFSKLPQRLATVRSSSENAFEPGEEGNCQF